MADPKSIAMMIMGKKAPEMHQEPDGDEPPGANEMRAQLVDELSAMDPKQLVEMVATVMSENPDVLKAFQDELAEPMQGSESEGMSYGGAA